MSKSGVKNLHVPLPDGLNKELRAEAKRVGQPATKLAREAIQKLLEERKRAVLYGEIRAYAEAIAETRQDYDPELEAASIDHILDSDEDKE